MSKIKVSPQIFEQFPEVKIGILVVKNTDNTGNAPEITALLRAVEKEVRSIPDIEPVNSFPKIAAWWEAHKNFGNSPKKYPPSVQSIIRRVVKGGELPSINKLVDLYNYISLKYIVPAGGEDLDRCAGDIQLTLAEGNEDFKEIGATENNPPEPGEVVYKDEAGVICRKWNWREGDRTKLTEKTKNALLVLEALPPADDTELRAALSDLKTLVQKYCGGEIYPIILQKDNLEGIF